MKRTQKKTVIAKHAAHKTDTGSAPVQIAILTTRIGELTEHLKEHKKDDHSRKGLLLMVGKRSKLLKYVKEEQPEQYEPLIKSLGIRK